MSCTPFASSLAGCPITALRKPSVPIRASRTMQNRIPAGSFRWVRWALLLARHRAILIVVLCIGHLQHARLTSQPWPWSMDKVEPPSFNDQGPSISCGSPALEFIAIGSQTGLLVTISATIFSPKTKPEIAGAFFPYRYLSFLCNCLHMSTHMSELGE